MTNNKETVYVMPQDIPVYKDWGYTECEAPETSKKAAKKVEE